MTLAGQQSHTHGGRLALKTKNADSDFHRVTWTEPRTSHSTRRILDTGLDELQMGASGQHYRQSPGRDYEQSTSSLVPEEGHSSQHGQMSKFPVAGLVKEKYVAHLNSLNRTAWKEKRMNSRVSLV